MKYLRGAAKLLAFCGWTAFIYLLYLVSRITHLGGRSLALRTKGGCFRLWGQGVARILLMRVEAEGRPPAAPFFLVSNHLSYLDIVLLAMYAPVFFVAKSEVAGWPILGFLARSMGTVFVPRESPRALPGVLDSMQKIMRAGHGVAFFPEATSTDGRRVLRFRTSLFEAPAQMGYPVFCASLWYRTLPGEPSAREAVCWWGDMTFPDHFWRMLCLRGLEARVSFDDEPIAGTDRKELAVAAQAAVERRFQPVPTEKK